MAEELSGVVDTTPEVTAEPVDNFADAAPEQPVQQIADDQIPAKTNTASEWAEPSDDQPAESPVAKAEPVAPATPFNKKLLEQEGLTEEEAKHRFGSPDVFEAAVRYHDSRIIKKVEDRLRQQAQQKPGSPTQQLAPKPQQAPVPQAQDAAKSRAFSPLDPKEWGEDVAKLINGLNDHYAQQLNELAKSNESHVQRSKMSEKALIGLLQHGVAQNRATYYRQFDESVNALPEHYRGTFGEGTEHDLDQGSEQYRNRQRLDRAIKVLSYGRKQEGLGPLPFKSLLDRALNSEFSKIKDAAVRQETQVNVGKRQTQFMPRATAKRQKPLTSDERAEQFVGDKLREMGITVGAEIEGDFAAGLPD